jgi:hypothetical protein
MEKKADKKQEARKMQTNAINYAPQEEVLAEVERIIAANQKLMKKLAKM